MACVQAQLKAGREEALRAACPALTDELIAMMKRSPMRGYDPAILKEPHIYRFQALPRPDVCFLSLQPLWSCFDIALGAYKLQVVSARSAQQHNS